MTQAREGRYIQDAAPDIELAADAGLSDALGEARGTYVMPK